MKRYLITLHNNAETHLNRYNIAEALTGIMWTDKDVEIEEQTDAEDNCSTCENQRVLAASIEEHEADGFWRKGVWVITCPDCSATPEQAKDEWAPTHYSTVDGTQVRCRETNGHRTLWENEDGETWWEDSAYWRPIVDIDPTDWNRSKADEAAAPTTGRLSERDPSEQSVPRSEYVTPRYVGPGGGGSIFADIVDRLESDGILHRIDPPTSRITVVKVQGRPDGSWAVYHAVDGYEMALWDSEQDAIDWCREMGYEPRPYLEQVVFGATLVPKSEALIHKATPLDIPTEDNAPTLCHHCAEEIRVVPGGHGPTWVHSDTGAVAASGGSR